MLGILKLSGGRRIIFMISAGLYYSKFIVSSSFFDSAEIRGGHKVTYSGVEFSEVSSHYAMMEQI